MPRVMTKVCVLTLVCLSTGASPSPAGTVSAGGPDTVRFQPFRCVDTAGTGDEAFRLLVPEGWQFSGGVQWVLDNPGLPATAAFSVTAPDGKAAFQVLPTQSFFWTNIQKILGEFPPGSRYYGGEVRAPMQPLEALKEVVIPRFRPGAKNLKVLQEQPLPDLARGLSAGVLAQPDAETSASGARIRIRYAETGIEWEEEIACVVETILYHFASPTGTQTTMMWDIGYILSFRSAANAFAERAGILETMAFSFQWNPRWFSKYCQLVATLMGRRVQRLKDMDQLARILGRAKPEPNEAILGFFREREAVYRAIAERFASVLPAVERYHDPLQGKTVELPAGYRSAWASASGEFVLSRDAGFAPAEEEPSAAWQRIHPVEGGP